MRFYVSPKSPWIVGAARLGTYHTFKSHNNKTYAVYMYHESEAQKKSNWLKTTQ